jgi:predicted transposase/invertase (TIGR01784 family)
LDKGSPQELIEEVIKMDAAIEKTDKKLRTVSQDEETRRIYEMREKAMSDWTSGVNHARREGELVKALAIARNMMKRNRPIDEIIEDTGLTRAEVEKLK